MWLPFTCDAAPIDLCRDAVPIDLCRDAAPIDLYRDAAPIDLYRDAVPIDLYRDAVPIDLCRDVAPVTCDAGPTDACGVNQPRVCNRWTRRKLVNVTRIRGALLQSRPFPGRVGVYTAAGLSHVGCVMRCGATQMYPFLRSGH